MIKINVPATLLTLKCNLSDQLIPNTDFVTNLAPLKVSSIANYFNQFRYQRRSKNVEKSTPIKGRLPDQTVILFNCVPFQNENFS